MGISAAQSGLGPKSGAASVLIPVSGLSLPLLLATATPSSSPPALILDAQVSRNPPVARSAKGSAGSHFC